MAFAPKTMSRGESGAQGTLLYGCCYSPPLWFHGGVFTGALRGASRILMVSGHPPTQRLERLVRRSSSLRAPWAVKTPSVFSLYLRTKKTGKVILVWATLPFVAFELRCVKDLGPWIGIRSPSLGFRLLIFKLRHSIFRVDFWFSISFSSIQSGVCC
jgi:hypothetical protein